MDFNTKNVDYIGKGQNQLKVNDAIQAKNILLKTTTSENDMKDSIAAVVYKATMTNPNANTKNLMKSRRICFDLDQE
jgi:hypothetical protein